MVMVMGSGWMPACLFGAGALGAVGLARGQSPARLFCTVAESIASAPWSTLELAAGLGLKGETLLDSLRNAARDDQRAADLRDALAHPARGRRPGEAQPGCHPAARVRRAAAHGRRPGPGQADERSADSLHPAGDAFLQLLGEWHRAAVRGITAHPPARTGAVAELGTHLGDEFVVADAGRSHGTDHLAVLLTGGHVRMDRRNRRAHLPHRMVHGAWVKTRPRVVVGLQNLDGRLRGTHSVPWRVHTLDCEYFAT